MFSGSLHMWGWRVMRGPIKGAKASLHHVTVHKAAVDIEAVLGLEEIPHEYMGSNVSGGFRVTDDELSGT